MQQLTGADALARDFIEAVREDDAAEGLRTVRELRAQLATVERIHVETMTANGYSWTEIANALGVTKSAAWQRFASA